MTSGGVDAPPPDARAALLPPEVDPATGEGLREDAPPSLVRQVLDGMVWGRLGRGDLAWATWDAVVAPRAAGRPPVADAPLQAAPLQAAALQAAPLQAAPLHAWIAAERGRLLRELGDHPGAEALEAAALAAPSTRDPVDRAMLLISLAADAIGAADAPTATHRLAAARAILAELPTAPRVTRQQLRAGWVGVEIALLTGERPDDSCLPTADGSVPEAYRAGTRFHLAKGLLFAGVVHRSLPLLDRAQTLAPPALGWAVEAARASLGAPGAAAAADQLRAEVVAPPPATSAGAASPPVQPG